MGFEISQLLAISGWPSDWNTIRLAFTSLSAALVGGDGAALCERLRVANGDLAEPIKRIRESIISLSSLLNSAVTPDLVENSQTEPAVLGLEGDTIDSPSGVLRSDLIWTESAGYGILRLADRVLRRIRLSRPPGDQQRILTAFQELGWPVEIDDPLPPKERRPQKRRLQDAVGHLNRSLKPLLRFRTVKDATAVALDLGGQ
ncbi:MAG: hypothetical protein QM775_10185 [Pirellulales bacterium]